MLQTQTLDGVEVRVYSAPLKSSVRQVSASDIADLENGHVILVRSKLKRDLGDHYISISLKNDKRHISIYPAGDDSSLLLDEFSEINGVIALQLSMSEVSSFNSFHNISSDY